MKYFTSFWKIIDTLTLLFLYIAVAMKLAFKFQVHTHTQTNNDVKLITSSLLFTSGVINANFHHDDIDTSTKYVSLVYLLVKENIVRIAFTTMVCKVSEAR